SPIGSGMDSFSVIALAVFDDGTGPSLFAGGDFTTAGGVTVNYIARWNGSNWSTLGSGMSGSVDALTVFDDGAGSALYAGGGFYTAGGIAARSVAKWNGISWSALGGGTGGQYDLVLALTDFDDGTGPALYAGGDFTRAGDASSSFIAKWSSKKSGAVNAGAGP